MDLLALPRRLAVLAVCTCMLWMNGCNILGAAGALLATPPDTGAVYTKLKGETVGVLVWVDRGARLDYPTLQMDIAKSLTTKLGDLTQPKDKKTKPQPELVGIQYLPAMSIIRFQEDHPELEGLPASDVAVRLGVTRVISVEVKDFRTHSPESPDIFKGLVAATVQVIEVTPGPNKVATVGYNNPSMEVNYPTDRPEGIPFGDTSSQMVYDRSIDEFTTEVAFLFFRHPSKDH